MPYVQLVKVIEEYRNRIGSKWFLKGEIENNYSFPNLKMKGNNSHTKGPFFFNKLSKKGRLGMGQLGRRKSLRGDFPYDVMG